MIQKEVIAFGRPIMVGCDGNCKKAWGINNRPKIQLDDNNEDDYAFLSDNELGDAPEDPGTYEGFEMCSKPLTDDEKFNKWCFRECERAERYELGRELKLDNWDDRVYNIKR
jgi:hypothetical protein